MDAEAADNLVAESPQQTANPSTDLCGWCPWQSLGPAASAGEPFNGLAVWSYPGAGGHGFVVDPLAVDGGRPRERPRVSKVTNVVVLESTGQN